ncbi:hypothetical protein QE429_003863 [Bacillus sp. SORGH_AS 510]|uniref:hypothetical protein n=1 Tax=Bacillus sp. SORGH_AS_0510 TaxID=3041771 RepID=UPI00278B6F19|nr:hypothetical protein [Bacillus sp. SORGH_AS_0510]MDQ1147036.1 hypothetical protein [Bacillus sp. SORGH_AS_0510]
MKVPLGADFSYEEDGIQFRVYHKNKRIKLYARQGNKTVIQFGETAYQAAEKAKERLLNKQAPL